MVEPTIEFKEPEKVAEAPQQIPKKPILVYKPTAPGQLPPAAVTDSSEFFKIKKKWIIILLLIIFVLIIGFVGFLIGKFV
jgi:hypothetical protein